MPIEDANYTIAFEMLDSRSLGVMYEDSNRKLSILCEMSAKTEGSWIATADLCCWQNGEIIQDTERQLVFARLNEWGQQRGWRFEKSVKLLEVRLEDLPPEERESTRKLQELARESLEHRKRIYKQWL